MVSTACVDTATAAARRRQRRLRSWLRHERMTVAMTLAEKLHHTSRGQKLARVGEEVVHDAHDALRRKKTPPPGVRPGSLCDPGPQRSDRTVRRSSGEVPLLAVPVLAGGDGVDGTALSFLVRRAVEVSGCAWLMWRMTASTSGTGWTTLRAGGCRGESSTAGACSPLASAGMS